MITKKFISNRSLINIDYRHIFLTRMKANTNMAETITLKDQESKFSNKILSCQN